MNELEELAARWGCSVDGTKGVRDHRLWGWVAELRMDGAWVWGQFATVHGDSLAEMRARSEAALLRALRRATFD